MGFLMKLWPPFPVCFLVWRFFFPGGEGLWRCGDLLCVYCQPSAHTSATLLGCRTPSAICEEFKYTFYLLYIMETFSNSTDVYNGKS